VSESDLVRAAKAAGRMMPAPIARALRFVWHRRGAVVARRSLRPDPEAVAWAAAHPAPVSIVIPSYNDVPLLTKCLASIEQTLAGTEYEVIVVDDYCQPENSRKLRALESERVRVLFKEQRGGFAVTVNQGMAAAAHDIVLVNSDIVALDGWLDALRHAARGGRDDRIGLVSARLIYPDGRIQYGGTIWSRTFAPQWFAHRYAGHLASYGPAAVPDYNWGASGACLYITREAYAELGGLDERYWLGFEDVDYAMRAWEKGFRSFYEARAVLVHHESASRGRHQGNRELASMRLFWDKWNHLHTRKTRGVPTRDIDVLIDDTAEPLWRRYVESLVTGLGARGWNVVLHEVDPDDADDLIDRLAARPSIALATTESTLRTAWLASVLHGIPMHLLSGLAEAAAPATIAALKPEFDFIAPNRWTATVLERQTSWPAHAVVAPAIEPVALPEPADDRIVVVTPDQTDHGHAVAALRARWPQVEVLETRTVDDAVVERLRELRPRVLVCLTAFATSLEPLVLMSLGAAFVGVPNDKTAFEVMDGFNALLVAPDDTATLIERVRGLLEDEAAYAGLRQNGVTTAADRARAGVVAVSLALDDAALRRG